MKNTALYETRLVLHRLLKMIRRLERKEFIDLTKADADIVIEADYILNKYYSATETLKLNDDSKPEKK